MYRVSKSLNHFALALIAGGVAAMLWNNLAPASYVAFVEYRLADSFPIGLPDPTDGNPFDRILTLGYALGEGLIAFYFLIMAKELWEALILPGGALHGRRAVAPLAVATGAALGAVGAYLLIGAWLNDPILPGPAIGWTMPIGGDVVLAFALGRAALGPRHPALRFVLLVVLVDDLIALALTTAVYPMDQIHLGWLVLAVTVGMVAYGLLNWMPQYLDRDQPLRPAGRALARLGVWPWLVAGILSWFATQEAGLLPALGLLPIVPSIPHTDHAFGVFAEAEEHLGDMFNRIAQLLHWPLMVILFAFALTQAGAPLWSFHATSIMVAGALIVGKPLGVFVAGVALKGIPGLSLPAGLRRRDMPAIGLLSSLGFTAPLVALDSALPDGTPQEAARLGLWITLLVAPVALALMSRLVAPPPGPEPESGKGGPGAPRTHSQIGGHAGPRAQH